MANKISYRDWDFLDNDIVSTELYLDNAMIGETVTIDTLSCVVRSDATGIQYLLTVYGDDYAPVGYDGYEIFGNDIRVVSHNEPITYYRDNVLVGKFYVTSVTRLTKETYEIQAQSYMGVLEEEDYLGGLYLPGNSTTVGALIDDIMGDAPYSIDNDIAGTDIYGWIPVCKKKYALQLILLAVGGSVAKDSNGDPYFKYLSSLDSVSVLQSEIYENGTINYTNPVAKVSVTEHEFLTTANDQTDTLFDNTNTVIATNQLVVFTDPYYDLKWNGSTIPAEWEATSNYAVVSGNGVLTGKKYTHTRKVLERYTGIEGATGEKSVTEDTLISALNSLNVLTRITNFYKTSETLNYGLDISSTSVKTTNVISFTDQYGEEKEGIVKNLDINVSSTLKGVAKVVTGYRPSNFGNNYSNILLVTSDQIFTVPAGVTAMRIVLGQAGRCGQAATDGLRSTTTPISIYHDGRSLGYGGKAGEGGEAGKVLIADIEVTPGDTYSIGIGQPTSGLSAVSYNTTQPTGSEGGDTTFGTYTSADGSVLAEGYTNISNGEVYSLPGISGYAGADGGHGSTISSSGKYEGFDFTDGTTTWHGGASGSNRTSSSWTTFGGSGGGACYGSDGYDGADATSSTSGGVGGDGGNATLTPYTPVLGGGGIGGNGGGGGGFGGYYIDADGNEHIRAGGNGGSGSVSGAGGQGWALLMY